MTLGILSPYEKYAYYSAPRFRPHPHSMKYEVWHLNPVRVDSEENPIKLNGLDF